MRTILLLWGSLLLFCAQLHAQTTTQSVVNTSGNSFKEGFYQIDWSIGELALVNEMKGGNLLITNGFLQSTESTFSNTSLRFTDDEIRVLPNLTEDKIEVSLLTRQQGKVIMQVFDINGRVVYRKNLVGYGTGHVERISLFSLAAGTYFLKVDVDPAPGSVRKTGSYKILKL